MGRKSKAEITRNGGSPARASNKTFPPQAQPQERWLTVGVCLFLVLIVWAVFGQTLNFGFVNYDDDKFVTDNPHVLNGVTWEDVKWAFRFDQGDYWHPLTWLSLMLDTSVFGRGAGGMHLTNVLLHAANSLLLFLLLHRWTGALWRSALVAALFAIHPLRVESVAWVTERKDVLSTLFWILALWAYTCYTDKVKVQSSKAKIFYGLALVLFVLGLMSKAMLVTLPLVMGLLDYWPLKRMEQLTLEDLRNVLPRLLLEKIPFFLFSGISVVLTYWGQHRESGAPTAADLSLVLRLENVFVAYARYLEKTFWPMNLAIPYTHTGHWNWLEVGWSVVLMAGLCVVAWRLRQRKPYIFVGWFWFVVTLIPVIGLTRGWLQFMADRFTYVPLTGIFLLVVWSAADLSAGWRHHREIWGGCAVAILIALIVCARVQTSYWRNSITLWAHTLACTADNAIAHTDLGGALLQAGQVDEAIVHFQEALRINANDVRAHRNLGDAFLQKGQTDEAIQQLQRALEIDPKDTGSHIDLGIALYQLGRMTEAVAQYQTALEINPDNSKAYNNLGLALCQLGRTDEAVAQYQKALMVDPSNVETCVNLGNVLLQTGQFDKAVVNYQKALGIMPNDVEAHNNLGLALYQSGRVSEAIAHYQKALEINPDNAEIRHNLAIAQMALQTNRTPR